MPTKTLQPFTVIGIAVRTTNENGQAAIDIPQLWNRFFAEGVMHAIPNRVNNTLYCVYTDYEKDHTRPYTTLLGCQVDNLENIPDGFMGKIIDVGSFHLFTAKGNLNEGIVYKEWEKIWATELTRTYTTDFEVYDEKAQDPAAAEVAIYIAVK